MASESFAVRKTSPSLACDPESLIDTVSSSRREIDLVSCASSVTLTESSADPRTLLVAETASLVETESAAVTDSDEV